MILVDSSVWIDYFRGASTPQSDRLDWLLGDQPLLIADLVLTEVLQGFLDDAAFSQAHRLMTTMTVIHVGGQDVAIQAARNYRTLRAQGATVRKTIDTLIATRCIVDSLDLLYSDRDFDPFVEHLGLTSAMP